MKAFRTSAQYYEALADRGARLDREGPLLRKLLDEGPGNRVVDLACGTGLHAAFLAQHGAEISAFDLSEEMLVYAREHRSHPHIEFCAGAMQELSGGPWDLALCLGNSISLLPSQALVRQCFERVHQALAPQGQFLVQLLNYRAAAAQENRHRIEEKCVDGRKITALKSIVPHGDHSLLSLAFFDVDRATPSCLAEAAVLRHITQEELIETGEAAGFRLGAVYGDFAGAPYDQAASGDLVCVWRK